MLTQAPMAAAAFGGFSLVPSLTAVDQVNTQLGLYPKSCAISLKLPP